MRMVPTIVGPQFNEDIHTLLSNYPELTDSDLDSWSGHSFRSGISTILQTLGFTEQEIKSWGRWHSAAYMVYLKDQKARRSTFSKLKGTFSLILQSL